MSPVVRTIRKLEGLPEQKTVAGFEIETGVPIPRRISKNTPLLTALCALEVGQSLINADKASHVRRAAKEKHPQRSFLARTLSDGRARIWRTK